MRDQLEKNKALVRWYVEEFWNKGRVELLEEIFAPNLLADGRIKRFVAGWCKAFSDTKMTINSLIAVGNTVVLHETTRAVHTGVWEWTLGGLSTAVPPTGKEVTDQWIGILRIADGKIVESTGILTSLELAQQLGVVPASSEEHDR